MFGLLPGYVPGHKHNVHSERSSTMTARHILMAVVVVLAVAGEGRADFVLFGTEHRDITSHHSKGILWDFSTADVKTLGHISSTAYVYDDAVLTISSGSVGGDVYAYNDSGVAVSGGTGDVYGDLNAYNNSRVAVSAGRVRGGYLNAYDTSRVDISGGSVETGYLNAYDTSHVDISGGSVDMLLSAYDTSRVDISGGNVGHLRAYNDNNVDISGGGVDGLSAYDTSNITFYGTNFHAIDGLTLDGTMVLGTGLLMGKWFDGTSWITSISSHDSGATIRAVPEPATLSLLALGSLVALRRRRR